MHRKSALVAIARSAALYAGLLLFAARGARSEPVLDAGAEGPHENRPKLGRLPKKEIRRVIDEHINEVRSCYQRLLRTAPAAGGRIMIKFVVSASGSVASADLQSSTMDADKDHVVSDCIQAAMMRWEFPRPVGDGTVTVSYPFVLTPAAPPIAAGPGPQESVRLAQDVRVGSIDGTFFLYTATDATGIPANGLIAKTAAGLLLIDAPWTTAQTEAVLRWGDTQLKQPWIGAILTHDHPDRAGGVAALLQRHIPVGALDLTVARLEERGILGVSVLLKAAEGSRSDPRGFELYYPGGGHTRDNIVVWFPGAKALFGGCLIEDRNAPNLGFTGDADLASWSGAVRRVSGRYPQPRLVVPGHGEVVLPPHDPYARTLQLLRSEAR